MSLVARINALEKRLSERPDAGAMQRDAAEVTNRILQIAERFPDEAGMTPAEERERHFSPALRLAWSVRFARTSEELAAALDQAAKFLGEASPLNGD